MNIQPASIPPIPTALVRRAPTIRAGDIDGHQLPYLAGTWLANFPADADVRWLCDNTPSPISRSDLTALGDEARAGGSADRRRLLIATFMWGYPTSGGRSYRNAKTALRNGPLLDRILDKVVQAIASHEPGAAFDAFRNGELPGYHEGFFTKYLYFAARGDPAWPVGEARPLIFDSQVHASLYFLETVLAAPWAVPIPWSRRRRFLQYCAVLDTWASSIDCVGDQLELFLYRPPTDFRFEPAGFLRSLARTAVADVDAGCASASICEAVAALPQDLIRSVRG